MSTQEAAVRAAATALKTVIADATAAGLIVTWPRSIDGLATIVISETAAAAPLAPAARPAIAMAPVAPAVPAK